MNKLVVLDINGVIACNKNGLRITENGKRVVNELSKRYTIGLFSSTTKRNVDKFVAESGVADKFRFVYSREKTRHDELLGGYATVKHLQTVFAEHPEFNYFNTIIVDDTPEKVRYNPEQNTLIAKPNMDLVAEINHKFYALDRFWLARMARRR